MKEGHISILGSDGPGLSPNEPMAIVQRPLIPDGKYAIINRAKPNAKVIFWNSAGTMRALFFYYGEMGDKRIENLQVNNH